MAEIVQNNPLNSPHLANLSHCRERLEDAVWWVERVGKEHIGDLERIELAAIESKMRQIRKELDRLK